MKSFILLTFLFLGLAFYELSGGQEFEPEVRPSAAVAEVETTLLPSPEVVTRDEPDTIADVGTLPNVPETVAQPLIAEVVSPEVEEAEEAVAAAIAAALAAPAPEVVEEQPVLVSLASPLLDQRLVDASSLNVRAGPSTNDRVVTKLNRNEPVIVLSELDDGWALVRIGDAGTEGWVAARFLVQ